MDGDINIKDFDVGDEHQSNVKLEADTDDQGHPVADVWYIDPTTGLEEGNSGDGDFYYYVLALKRGYRMAKQIVNATKLAR